VLPPDGKVNIQSEEIAHAVAITKPYRLKVNIKIKLNQRHMI